MRGVPDLKKVGTSKRAPCGPGDTKASEPAKDPAPAAGGDATKPSGTESVKPEGAPAPHS